LGVILEGGKVRKVRKLRKLSVSVWHYRNMLRYNNPKNSTNV
jgi:hypothetical protein